MSIKDVNLQPKVDVLRKFKPFNFLDDALLFKVAASLGEEIYPAGAYIGRQGETSKHVLFLVVDGKVEITVSDKSGHEFVTGYRGPYEFMGEAVFLSGEEYLLLPGLLPIPAVFFCPRKYLRKLLLKTLISLLFLPGCYPSVLKFCTKNFLMRTNICRTRTRGSENVSPIL